MNKYKIKYLERDDDYTVTVMTTKGTTMSLSQYLVKHARVGDVIREYTTGEYPMDVPVAYYCRGHFELCLRPMADFLTRNFAADHLSCMERVHFNIGLGRALMHKKIMPTMSIANNLRLWLGSDEVRIR